MAEFTNEKSYSTLNLSIVTLGMYKKEGSDVGFEILIQTTENNDHSPNDGSWQDWHSTSRKHEILIRLCTLHYTLVNMSGNLSQV